MVNIHLAPILHSLIIAVFEEGEQLILARVGETVQNQFRVREIEYETVVMGYTDPRFEKLSETLNQSR